MTTYNDRRLRKSFDCAVADLVDILERMMAAEGGEPRKDDPESKELWAEAAEAIRQYGRNGEERA